MHLATSTTSLAEQPLRRMSCSCLSLQSSLISIFYRSQNSIAGQQVIASAITSPRAKISLWWMVVRSSGCRFLMRSSCSGASRLMEEGFYSTISQAVLPPFTKQESISLTVPVGSNSTFALFTSPWQVPSPARNLSASPTAPNTFTTSVSGTSIPRLLQSSMRSSRVRVRQGYSMQTSVRCSFSQEKAEIVCGLVKWFLSVRRWGWESWERTRRRERKAGRARWSSRAFWQTVCVSQLRITGPPQCGSTMWLRAGVLWGVLGAVPMWLLKGSIEHHSSAGFLPLFFLRLVRLAFLVSKGERGARLIFFSEAVLTKYWLAFTRFLPTLMCLWWMRTRAWWMDLAWKPSWQMRVCRRLSRNLLTVRPSTQSSLSSSPVRRPQRCILLRRAAPSKSLRGSFSSRVSSSLAALRKRERSKWTLQTSRLFFRPYLPTSCSSWSILSFSNGRRGVLNVDESDLKHEYGSCSFCPQRQIQQLIQKIFINHPLNISQNRTSFGDTPTAPSRAYQTCEVARRDAPTTHTPYPPPPTPTPPPPPSPPTHSEASEDTLKELDIDRSNAVREISLELGGCEGLRREGLGANLEIREGFGASLESREEG